MAALEPEGGPAPALGAARAAALAEAKRTFDRAYGGFGTAPKFPHPFELDACLRAFARSGDEEALAIVLVTLANMADGGIHDQLGGGFCRYSVDAEWTIPHFEKMLYDNGPLLALYADTARITGERRYADVARDIVGWLVRDMRADDGAYYSSLDADSEGEEGKFYVWTREEARAAVSDEEWVVAEPHYGFDRPPNFEGRAWNPRVSEKLDVIARRAGIDELDASTRLAGARAGLFKAREARVHPGRDDKILTSWNALAIAGIARAANALDMPRWVDLACDAADALRATAWRDGRLLATRHGHRVELNAYLDDHAFLLAALVELMQVRFRREDYDWACALADALLARFEDSDRGGFFFTSHDHARLFHRTKPGPDNATPSGNGIAAQALIALGHLASEPRYVEAAQRAVNLFAADIARAPMGYSTLLEAAAMLDAPPTLVVLVGDPEVCDEWHRRLAAQYRPSAMAIDLSRTRDAPAALGKGPAPASGAAAYVCRGATCLPAMSSLDEILASGFGPDLQ
jgi:uncharacterized protein YyaL (SSP411 family)